MIKRQFYSFEHRSRDSEASSASSSSSSSQDASFSAEEEEEVRSYEEGQEASSPGNLGSYNIDNAISDQDLSKDHCKRKQKICESSVSNQWADLVEETLKEKTADFTDECVITCKHVLKCRLCPKTICLSSETMQAHLVSKKHARSLKQMREGKLKVMLNSDGEEEEQGETHAERHARTVATMKVAVKSNVKRKRASGRQRQRKRVKRKMNKEQKSANSKE